VDLGAARLGGQAAVDVRVADQLAVEGVRGVVGLLLGAVDEGVTQSGRRTLR
jgi:hypothetical protein